MPFSKLDADTPLHRLSPSLPTANPSAPSGSSRRRKKPIPPIRRGDSPQSSDDDEIPGPSGNRSATGFGAAGEDNHYNDDDDNDGHGADENSLLLTQTAGGKSRYKPGYRDIAGGGMRKGMRVGDPETGGVTEMDGESGSDRILDLNPKEEEWSTGERRFKVLTLNVW